MAPTEAVHTMAPTEAAPIMAFATKADLVTKGKEAAEPTAEPTGALEEPTGGQGGSRSYSAYPARGHAY
eukprot:2067727-Lingulodinium_polyedra.AAC.1